MKTNSFSFAFTSAVLFCLTGINAFADPIAFPGAEGSGMYATGGRGGDVYEVTNLTNSGTGSIVDALSVGNRTVVFRVSGTIDLDGVILEPKSNTTIAGQTAPGDGICLKGRIKIGSSRQDIIIRYIRVRVDEGAANSSGDAIDIASGSDIIIDHVSASYARDETISCQDGSDNVTVQWCIMSEALTFEDHSYGSLIRGEYGEQKTYHHNLYIHNNGRNPRPGNYTDSGSDPDGLYFDFRNNVVYNWAGGHPGYNADTDSISRYNFVGNVFIKGAESSGDKAFKEDAVDAYAYWSGNAHGASYGTISVPSDQWDLVTFNGFSSGEIAAYKARSAEITMEPVTTTSAAQALVDVLEGAGASFPSRDIIDSRLVNDVINDTGSSIETTDDQPEGAWPTLDSLPAPDDNDHDGMPNTWEIAQGLDPNNAADRNYYDLHLDYTNLEVYLSSLVEADVEAPSAPANLSATGGDATVSLDWDDNSEGDLAGYNVYRSDTSGTGYVKLNSLLVTDSDYIDNSVTNGNTYYYVVTAVDTSSNESNYSNEDSATPSDVTFPAAPEGLWAVIADSNVVLDWNNNTEPDLDGYNVYRSTTSGGDYVQLNGAVLTESDYIDETAVSGTNYYYVVTAEDTSSNESADSFEVSAMLSNTAMGSILREYWMGISGSTVNDLTLHVNYPDYPSGSDQLACLTGPASWADSYGTRLRGYVHPPTTGDYTFYISSDNNSELWLSTDGNPANASIIASVSGYTDPQQWDKYTSQESSEIGLVGGRKYYIEVLHKESNDTDNLAVAWSGPGIAQQVIPSEYLSPWFIGLYGETTDDYTVNMDDLPDFIAMWLEDDCAASSAWDLNGDCIIDFYEFSILAGNWMKDFISPDAPTNFAATAGDGTVSLDWDDNSEDDLAGYNVYRSTTQGSGYVKLNVSLLSISDYNDNSVINGTTYYYVVTAEDTSSNESDYSNEDSATPNPPTTNITIQENEMGFCGVDGIIESEHSGYTGDGYANTDNASGNGVDYSVNILTAGDYTFVWRFANGSSDRPGDLIINSSTEASGISFPGTNDGNWTNWNTTGSVEVTLTTGIKDIRLEATTSGGLANIDYMEVTGPNLEVASCP